MKRFEGKTVVVTGARRVFPVHYDDLTKPLGELELIPSFLDDILITAGWIDEFSRSGDQDVLVEQLPLGEPLILY